MMAASRFGYLCTAFLILSGCHVQHRPVEENSRIVVGALPSDSEILIPGSGIRVHPLAGIAAPTVKVRLPHQNDSDPGVQIELPESVLAQLDGGGAEIELYGNHHTSNEPPVWRILDDAIEYSMELGEFGKMDVRAAAEPDGLRLSYVLTNRSEEDYAWVLPATCVRLYSSFEDHYLERTYVHHRNGFELLASETPERLEMTLDEWYPCRYRAFHAWGWPNGKKLRIEKGGLVSYTKSRPIDRPFLATRSKDRKWVIATHTKDAGSVWTNPKRTCQHADPTVALKSGQTKILELKVFVLAGGLEDLLERVDAEANRGYASTNDLNRSKGKQ